MRQETVRPLAIEYLLDLILELFLKIILWARPKDTTTLKEGVSTMNLFELFAALQVTITELQAKLAEAETALAEAKQASYDEGFAAGAASAQSDKIYSQADLDAAVASAIAPLEAANADLMVQLDGVKANVAALEAQLAELTSGLEAKVSEAVAAFKAELLAKYQEAQAQETEIEKTIEDLLK